MSKITQALEKAARERLLRQQEQVTAPAEPVTVAVAIAPSTAAVRAAVMDRVRIDPHIITVADSKSPITEQYRILKANLQSIRGQGKMKTIVVTSALHAEGKSVTALNLALTLSRDEQMKVLLIDGDMRKGSINRWLGVPDAAQGLSTVLANGGELNGCLFKLQSPGLTILPAGPVPDDPAALLESGTMRRLLSGLRAQFDLVLIDAPPVLAVADPAVLASQADGALLVVRAGRTQRKTVLQAQQRLEQMKADVFGCVLTQVDYYFPGYYHYYRQEQQKQQGTHGGTIPSSAN